MNLNKHFWSFKNKDQRRFENDQEKSRQEHLQKNRADDLSTHTHLDHIGRKGFLGLEQAMPSFIRHTKNLIYSRWVRGKVKTKTFEEPLK